MRTEQDKINRREANRKYYKLEENKQQKRDYMKEYSKRDYVVAKRKNNFYPAHEAWAQKNGYREPGNEKLNIENSEIFIKNAKK